MQPVSEVHWEMGGGPLWDGDWENIDIRRSTNEEIERWKQSLLSAIQAGEQEPDEQDWVIFLVPIHDPTDDPD